MITNCEIYMGILYRYFNDPNVKTILYLTKFWFWIEKPIVINIFLEINCILYSCVITHIIGKVRKKYMMKLFGRIRNVIDCVR